MAKNEWLGDDGPLVLLAQATAAAWTGEDGDDYDHACEALEEPAHAAVVPYGGGMALAIETSGHQVTIVSSPDGALVAKWIFAPSEDAADRALAKLDADLSWRDTGLLWKVPGGGVLLQVAAEAQGEEALRFALAEGTYAVATALYEPDDDMSFELFRLRRAG